MALLKAENDRLTLLLEESKNWKHDMESQLKKSKGQVYVLEAELFLAKFAQDDLKEEEVRMATENERLKQEQVTERGKRAETAYDALYMCWQRLTGLRQLRTLCCRRQHVRFGMH